MNYKNESQRILRDINSSNYTQAYHTDFKNSMPKEWDFSCKVLKHCLDKLVFANDVLHIPPTKVFLELYKRKYALESTSFTFTSAQARKIGTFWGYVFTFGLQYTRVTKPVYINTLGVKSASVFELKDRNRKRPLADFGLDEVENQEL